MLRLRKASVSGNDYMKGVVDRVTGRPVIVGDEGRHARRGISCKLKRYSDRTSNCETCQ